MLSDPRGRVLRTCADRRVNVLLLAMRVRLPVVQALARVGTVMVLLFQPFSCWWELCVIMLMLCPLMDLLDRCLEKQ